MKDFIPGRRRPLSLSSVVPWQCWCMKRLLMSFIHFNWRRLEEQTFELCTCLDPVPKFFLQDSGTLAIGRNWILKAGRSLSLLSLYRCWKGSWEFIQINLNKIGTKIQVSWFSKRMQVSASHLLGPSHALRALPVSHLLSSASAKPTPRNSHRGLVFRHSLFQITTPTFCCISLGKLHDLSVPPFLCL